MKIKNKIQALFASAAACLAFSSFAAPIIDINQSANNVDMANFSQSDLAQSFKPTQATIAGAGITLFSGIGSTDIVTIGLWSALPNQQGATELASASGLATAGTAFDIFFDAVNVTIGQTYYLVFSSAANTLGIAGSTNNPYLDGNTFANAGFMSFSTYDYTFRTYYDNASLSTVPEPTTVALLGLGLLGFAAARRKTAKK